MPEWKVHLIFGLLLLVLWLNTINILSLMVLNFQKLVALILLIPFVSTFPDIDTKQSKSRKALSLILSVSISLLYMFLFPSSWYYGFAYFFILYFLMRLLPTKHRGFTHSFKFSLVFSISITYLLYLAFSFNQTEFLSWFLLIALTYTLHLVLDKF